MEYSVFPINVNICLLESWPSVEGFCSTSLIEIVAQSEKSVRLHILLALLPLGIHNLLVVLVDYVNLSLNVILSLGRISNILFSCALLTLEVLVSNFQVVIHLFS